MTHRGLTVTAVLVTLLLVSVTLPAYNPVSATSMCIASDPGDTSLVRIISGTGSFETVSSSNKRITVSPDSILDGTVILRTENQWSASAIVPFVFVTSWGKSSESYWTISPWITDGVGTYVATVDGIEVPYSSGSFFLVFAFRAEKTPEAVASCTNWECGSPVWFDSSNLADVSPEKISDAQSNGRTNILWLLSEGYTPLNVPCDAITIGIDSSAESGNSADLRITSTHILMTILVGMVLTSAVLAIKSLKRRKSKKTVDQMSTGQEKPTAPNHVCGRCVRLSVIASLVIGVILIGTGLAFLAASERVVFVWDDAGGLSDVVSSRDDRCWYGGFALVSLGVLALAITVNQEMYHHSNRWKVPKEDRGKDSPPRPDSGRDWKRCTYSRAKGGACNFLAILCSVVGLFLGTMAVSFFSSGDISPGFFAAAIAVLPALAAFYAFRQAYVHVSKAGGHYWIDVTPPPRQSYSSSCGESFHAEEVCDTFSDDEDERQFTAMATVGNPTWRKMHRYPPYR